MSCNPAIGGLAKGQMVREVDALGGLMGVAIDNTGIQFRMLNRSKGPAVWGPRAQADKYKYAVEVQRLLGTCPNLEVVRGEVGEIVTEVGSGEWGVGRKDGADWATPTLPTPHSPPPTPDDQRVTGVVLADGTRLTCRAVIVGSG